MKASAILVSSTAAVMLLNATSVQAQIVGLKSAEPLSAGQSELVHKVGRRGRRNGAVAAGVALGVLGIAAAAASASARDDVSPHERRCNRWRRWCRDGEREACWKFDNRC